MVAAAISSEEGDVCRPSEKYVYEDGCLVVDVSANNARDLGKSLNSILSRFKLSVETIGLCKRLEGKDQVEQKGLSNTK
ncbi:ekc/keops complex subunit LAGE3 [Encephalitozoon hellem]|uniref:Ekc/keops complex subunit LAGE3 n=1 Tax=Encephalitozoon hellem TaxID=27973 RepID=A0ABY8CHP9_ENCHE|nr:ekc/keops complex subunit LAGE3 [Encephalitozoon hellem]